jgi:hypothetical protein
MPTLLRVFLTLFATVCGFTAGAMIGAAVLVSPDAGLAGGAEVVFYGAAGAIIAGIAGGFAVRRLGRRVLAWTALAAALVLGVLFSLAP